MVSGLSLDQHETLKNPWGDWLLCHVCRSPPPQTERSLENIGRLEERIYEGLLADMGVRLKIEWLSGWIWLHAWMADAGTEKLHDQATEWRIDGLSTSIFEVSLPYIYIYIYLLFTNSAEPHLLWATSQVRSACFTHPLDFVQQLCRPANVECILGLQSALGTAACALLLAEFNGCMLNAMLKADSFSREK